MTLKTDSKIKTLREWKQDGRKVAEPVAASIRSKGLSVVRISVDRSGIDDVAKMFANVSKDVIERVLADLRADDIVANYTMSTDEVDRPGDRVMQDGWVLDNFHTNPVMLFAHDSRQPTIGHALATFVDRNALKGVFKFTRDDEYAFGAMIGRQVLGKHMRAGSVGFQPLEFRIAEERMDPEDPWAEWFPPIDFTKQELLEFSACPIPANPSALADGKSAPTDLAMLRQWAEGAIERSALVPGVSRVMLEKLARAGVSASTIVDLGKTAPAPVENAAPAATPPAKPEDTQEGDPVTDPSSTDEPVAKDDGEAQGQCPMCSHAAPLQCFVDAVDGDETPATQTESEKACAGFTTRTLQRELRRRGIAVVESKAVEPPVQQPVQDKSASSCQDELTPDEASAYLKERLASITKQAVEDAVAKSMGRLPR